VAHLFTGKNLDGSVIGIAYLGVVCDVNDAYGLSQSRYTTNFSLRVSLTAHELGHNWNAQHCDASPPCGIMCSSNGGCGGDLTHFGATPLAAIIAWRNSAGCLTPSNLPPQPFNLSFPYNGVGNQSLGPIISWFDAQYATSYTLLVDDDPDFTSPVVNMTVADGPVNLSDVLTAGTMYFWTVTAHNAIGSTLSTPAVRAFMTSQAFPTALHVDDSAAAGGSGASFAVARNDLEDAIQAAAIAAPAISEIRLGPGLYRPAPPNGDRTLAFTLLNNVAIRGGYAGTGAPDPLARDVEAYLSILSGDLNANDGPPGSFTNDAENSRHVVTTTDNDASAVLDGVTITGGNANTTGLDGNGGGLLVESSDATIRNCTIIHNSVQDDGGGLSIRESSAPMIVNCAFLGNRATSTGSDGGGIYIHNSSGTFINCLVAGNSARNGGGFGGSTSATANLTSCTIAHNTLTGGAGAVRLDNSATVTVSNAILWNPGIAEVSSVSGGAATISSSDVEGGFGAGNLNADPLFVDANGADNVTGTADDDLRLGAGSPALDVGNPASLPADTLDLDGDADTAEPLPVDLDGDARVQDGDGTGGAIVDMGAYESETPPPACPADCASPSNGAIDVGDLLELLAGWGGPGACDVNQSGTIDVADLLELLADWGACL
jgi:hypothetical protein